MTDLSLFLSRSHPAFQLPEEVPLTIDSQQAWTCGHEPCPVNSNWIPVIWGPDMHVMRLNLKQHTPSL